MENRLEVEHERANVSDYAIRYDMEVNDGTHLLHSQTNRPWTISPLSLCGLCIHDSISVNYFDRCVKNVKMPCTKNPTKVFECPDRRLSGACAQARESAGRTTSSPTLRPCTAAAASPTPAFTTCSASAAAERWSTVPHATTPAARSSALTLFYAASRTPRRSL